MQDQRIDKQASRLFRYTAVTAQGESVSGQAEATDARELIALLRGQNLTPIEVEAGVPQQARKRSRRITPAIRNQAIQEMTTLLQAGVSIAEALQSLCEGHATTALGGVFEHLQRSLRQGLEFSDALAGSGLALPPYVLQMIRAGESGGELASSMGLALEQLNYLESNRQEMRNALIYPVILVLTGITAVGLIFAIVVPKFARLLEQGGDKVPWLSRAVLHSGLYVHDHWLLLLGLFLAFLALGWSALQQPGIRRGLDNLTLRLPLLGEWVLRTQLERWSRSLGTLLASRVPLSDALALSQDAITLQPLRNRLEQVHGKVRDGGHLTEALQVQHLVDPMGANLLRVGEASGTLSEMLLALAKVYSEKSRQRMKRFLLLLEPLAILMIGAAIGILMIAIMLAITSVNDIGF